MSMKTYLPLLMGIIAGIISFLLTGDFRSRDPFGIIVLIFFIYIHKYILPKFGEEVTSGKDWLAVGFLTLTTWYITWTILLNL